MEFVDGIKRLPTEPMDAEGLSEEQAALLAAARAFLDSDEAGAERLASALYRRTCDEQIKEAARSLLFALLTWQDRFGELAQYALPRDAEDAEALALYSATPRMALPPEPVELPMPLVIKHLPAVRVFINGAQATLLIDTGAMITTISQRVARAAGARFCGQTAEGRGATGHAFQLESADIESLRIGGIELRGVRCAVIADELFDMEEDGAIDGAIGWELIKRLRWTIDCRARRVKIEASTPMALERNLCCDFFPMARVTAWGRELVMGLDTGAALSSFGKSALRFLPEDEAAERSTKGVGPAKQVRARPIDQLDIGICGAVARVRDIYALADEEYSHSAFFLLPGALGSDIAKGGALLLDWPNRHLSILPGG